MKFGLSESDWTAAKAEIVQILAERARLRGMIPYSKLVSKMKAVRLEAHDTRLFNLLGEVSSDEDSAGRGLLSVLVVHKSGDMQPGPGFFEVAGERGRDTTEILRCWIEELKIVHAYWLK